MDWNRRFEQVFASGGDASTKGGTLIGAGAHIIGDVISAESVELSGHITGRLVSGNGQKEGSVLVQAKGSLQGHLVGDAVTILAVEGEPPVGGEFEDKAEDSGGVVDAGLAVVFAQQGGNFVEGNEHVLAEGI